MAFSIGSSLVNATSSGLKMPGPPTIGTITLNSAKTASMAFTPGLPPGFTYSVTTTQGDGTGTGTASPISITNLIGNKSYNFILTAYRMTLSKSSAISSSYLTKPDAVTIGAVTSLEITTASVGYTSPIGGAATYTITTDSAEGTGSTTVGTNPIPVTGLLGNKSYKFTITASNDTGSSTSTTAGSYLTKPTLVTIGAVSSITSSSASVAYTYATGNAATYTVTTDAAKGTGTGASPISVTGLDPNVSYYFIVTASNATGSNASKTTSTYLTKPGEPTLGTITVTGLTASVAYTAPTGGATTYIVYTTPTGGTGSSATSPVSVTGLSGNTRYSFIIYASNATGSSSEITSGSTYLTRPDAPTISTVTVTSSTQVSIPITVTGTTSNITAIAITSSPSITLTYTTTAPTFSGQTATIAVTGTFASGIGYTFTMTVTNAKETSASSTDSNSVTPKIAPVNKLASAITNATIWQTSDETVYVFASNGSITFSRATSGRVTVIGGGGGGGYDGGGGGGGGGIVDFDMNIPANTYAITIGAGGDTTNTYSLNGGKGGDSSVGTLSIAYGGGGGGDNHGLRGQTAPITTVNGASGGGQGASDQGDYTGPGTKIQGQGNVGGNSTTTSGGGGGSKQAVGNNASGSIGGAGGAGYSWTYTGYTLIYGGGGGGGTWSGSGGAGGSGGGGAGAVNNSSDGNPGTAYGGGGGGGGGGGRTSGAGYKGAVFISIYINVPTAGLLYYYRFNIGDINASSRLANYATGSPVYDATVYGSPTFSSGANTFKVGGSSLQLVSASSQYINIDTFTTTTSGITITCWFYFTVGGWKRLFDFGVGRGNDNILYAPGNGLSVFHGGSASTQPGGATAGYADSTWHLFAWTMSCTDITNYKGTWNMYIDNVLTYTNPDAGYPLPVARSNNYIGLSNWINDDGYSEGYIDEFRYYNRVLSTTELTQIYNYV